MLQWFSGASCLKNKGLMRCRSSCWVQDHLPAEQDFLHSASLSKTGRADSTTPTKKKKKGESTIVPSIIIRSLCLCLWKLSLLHYITLTPKQCICNANQPLSCICTTVITWKNLFNIRRLSGADEWLLHDIHGIEIQLKTASGTEVVVIVQHVPWGLCWNTAISCTGWEILFSFMTIC